MSNSEPKQVIVMRTDLRNSQGHKIRTGKLIAQGAHASLGAILNYSKVSKIHPQEDDYSLVVDITKLVHPALYEWLSGRFTKVCVQVKSEQELLDIYNKATQRGVNVKLIQDAGLTEFGGIPTHTCLAIGPDYPENIDPITGHLPLL
ncbi:MAG: aminoacyl-tRNA hydrolase [Nitrososphaeraceae archaeon]